MAFLIISIIIFNLIAIIIPKRMTRHEIYTTSLFALCFAMIADIIFDLKYDWYGYLQKGVQISGIIAEIGLFPALSTMILNYFPYGKSLKYKAYYVLAWSVFSIVFEWASLKSGYFYYNGWIIWYSMLWYPAIIIVMAVNLYIIRSLKD